MRIYEQIVKFVRASLKIFIEFYSSSSNRYLLASIQTVNFFLNILFTFR